MATVTPAELDRLVGLLVENVNPRMVILFGSQAGGETTEHSDLDLMIIEDERSLVGDQGKLKHIAAIYRLLRVVRIPKDILVYSVEKFEEWQGSLNHVIGRASREGRVLYERQ